MCVKKMRCGDGSSGKGLLFFVLLAAAACSAAPLRIVSDAKTFEADSFAKGATVFADRAYRLAEPPASLAGARFLRAPIGGYRIVCNEPLRVRLLTPPPVRRATSQGRRLEALGFVREESIPAFQLFGTNDHERTCVFSRQMSAGESVRLGKWTVLLDPPAFEVVAPPPAPPKVPWEKNDGERLYNGIVLPKAWPPDDAGEKLDVRKPMSVPYLEHPPAVIDIDVGRQLFVDGFLVEKTDMLPMYKLPEKYDGNPVLKPEVPLESPEGVQGGCSRPCVWYVPEKGVYRMWYVAGTYYRGTVAIAESEDGLHWKRVNQDVNPGTNQTWPTGFQTDSWSVAPDPYLPVGAPARWKLFATNPGGLMSAWSWDSADGIHWEKPVRTGETEDRATMFFNPFRRVWVYSVKGGHRVSGRSRKYREGADFKAAAKWDYDELPWWTSADELDVPEPGYGHKPQLYNLDAVAYESLMLGFFEIHRGPENRFCERRGLPKLNEITFGYSRDGFHWSRPDRRAQLPASRADTWDRGFIEGCGNICFVAGDKLIFVHSGCRGDEDFGTGVGEWHAMYDRNSIGVSTLRRDGFCAMNAGGHVATLLTRPVRFSGSRLFVNVDSHRGEFKAEVLDEKGEPIEPFTLEKCRGVSVDSTHAAVEWSEDLSRLAGRPVRFRFHLRKGDFYSFWVSKDARGASGGWLAGGGRGYGSYRDE